ncbi:MAG: tRNA pseudouridine(38-40) synthase TruA [Pseudomonadota bacterium]
MRYALCVEYQGNGFKGWQKQRHAKSVQACVEDALSKILDHEVEVVCAGRTDAGVHATYQTIHVDTHANRPLKAFTLGVNANLPHQIAVKWALPVDDGFHARFSALTRRYRYVIYNHQQRPGIFYNGVTHIHRQLDANLMHEAAQSLIGEHDFTSFRASLCQSKTANRRVDAIAVQRRGNYVVLDIEANAFLHHMVRNIVGCLIEIGTSAQPISWLADLLSIKDRTQAAATAKPNGLYLISVTYPEKYQLTPPDYGPLFYDL